MAKKYRGDRDNLVAALAKAKSTTRRNDVLSELADLDALPDEYVPAERAGKPSEQANELSDGAGCKASKDTHTAPTSDTPPAPDTDGKETEPAARKAKPKLSASIQTTMPWKEQRIHGSTPPG